MTTDAVELCAKRLRRTLIHPQFGRDAAQDAAALVKIGGGMAGFDFVRLCGNGDEEGQGSCPPGLTPAEVGTGAGQWADPAADRESAGTDEAGTTIETGICD